LALTFLHTNDWHGTLDDRLEAALAQWRREADLFFDTGDAIKAGNLGVPLRPESVWPRLARLNCTASVIGNRETHVLESAFQAKLSGVSHPVLCANLRRKDGSRPLPANLLLEVCGLRVAVFGVSVPMVTERMKTAFASTFLWDPPLEVAKAQIADLRPKADLLIALTHIGYRQDRALAELGGVDIILGGHSHTVLSTPEKVGNTYIAQGGSHGRFVGRYEWDGKVLTGGLLPLKA
jgi:5'-nucleotidase